VIIFYDKDHRAIGPFIAMILSQRGSISMVFATCAIVSAACLVIMPWLSVCEWELTEAQLEEMKGFRISNFFELRVIPISSVCLVAYFCYSSVVSFLAVYAQEVHLVEAASFFFVISAGVILITRPAIGRIFDSKGENLIVYTTIPIFTLGMVILSQTQLGVILLLSAALIGLGLGAIQSSTQAIVMKMTPSHRLGLANSTYLMCLDIGVGIGPSLAGLVVSFASYRGMYVGMAIIAGLNILLYYFTHGKQAGHMPRSTEINA
jgi:predicted MFS family arabinose efflux permease